MYQISRNNQRISNTGGATVTDVTCNYDESNCPYAFRQDKEPFEWLEPGESIEEVIFLPQGFPNSLLRLVGLTPTNKNATEIIITWQCSQTPQRITFLNSV